MTHLYHSMRPFPRKVTTSLILISMKSSVQSSQEMPSLPKENPYPTLETIPIQSSLFTSSISIGTTLKHGETLVTLMSMMSERHRIGMREDIWKRKIKELGISI